ncbi:Gfo/Idh/MocA family protein [Actinopolymorpha rutila]|uniref:Putative dehydrogenase n=1 Tax=Actinopolymorpha rutila TaxID=446787 RepID=A0A852ZNP0_9ACTN|nr:Gfo/Idh/MocA family oxidoreductase [Actinopolymorpha rutila]NYH90710.1 putative dehydrogenase [Actinopolymorpha rutila]
MDSTRPATTPAPSPTPALSQAPAPGHAPGQAQTLARRRVGLVGLGSIGVTHARVLAELRSEVELVAVSGGADTDLAELGWPRATRADPAEILARGDLDLVVLCGPTPTHAPQALAALRAGRNVVVEKPLALDVAAAQEIAWEAAQSGLLVSVMAQRRLEPQHLDIKRRLDAGELGRPLLGETFVHWHRDDDYYARASWRGRQESGGGSVMNQSVHNIDLLRWFLGAPVEVTAQSATLGHDPAVMSAEDTTVATLRFVSGALGVVVSSTAVLPGDPACLTLRTSTGTIELTHDKVTRWDLPGVPPPPDTPPNGGPAGGAQNPAAIGLAGHRAQWRDILDALREDRPPAVDVTDGVKTVRLLCAIYSAAATGRAVQLHPEP